MNVYLLFKVLSVFFAVSKLYFFLKQVFIALLVELQAQIICSHYFPDKQPVHVLQLCNQVSS